jgi:hypothetical protein
VTGNLAYSFVDSVDSDTEITLSNFLSDNHFFASGDNYIICRGGLWYSFKFANAEFFAIDTRAKRDPNNTPYGDMLDGRQFLGDDYYGNNNDHGGGLGSGHIQRDWLVDAVNNSNAKWKFILCELTFKHDEITNHDKWGDYDPNDDLRNYLKRNIISQNVIWLNADRHFAALDDASDENDPWPSANSSPLAKKRRGANPIGNWLVNGWSAEMSKNDGLEVTFGLIKVRNDHVTIKMFDGNGDIIHNGIQNLSMTIPEKSSSVSTSSGGGGGGGGGCLIATIAEKSFLIKQLSIFVLFLCIVLIAIACTFNRLKNKTN